jgi:hypothetical protein
LRECLTAAGVKWERLSETARIATEEAWRQVYGWAFRGRPRVRHGARAEHEYSQQPCDHYLVVPFSTGVVGLPVHVLGLTIGAYECRGRLVPLGTFHNAEFFVCPPDMSWAMIHTHEDHAIGGPYFIRREWLPGGHG